MMNEKQPKNEESSDYSINKAVALFILIAILSALDIYSHPRYLVADLKRRQILLDAIGPIANHLGNFAPSAALAMSAVCAKHILQNISDSKFFQEVVRHGFLVSISSIVAFNALIESFRGNNEPVADFSMGLFAIATGVAAAESIIKKVKQAKTNLAAK